MRPLKYSALLAAVAVFATTKDSALAQFPPPPPMYSPMVSESELAQDFEVEMNGADPQQDSQRTSSNIRSKAQTRTGGVSAGDKYVIPEAGNPEGSRNAIYSEYNYIDTGTDTAGIGTAGSANVYSFGYEHILSDTLFFDLSYEYSDDDLRPARGGAMEIDTHTVAGALSAVITNNIYGMIIVGGSFSDGGTNLNGVQLAGADGEVFFVNPGLGTTWVFGNVILDAAASYLYQDAQTTTLVGGAPFVGNNQTGQVVLEAGARYNISDTLYARVGLQYNNIVDEDFRAGIPLDKNWLQLNSEIGVELPSGVDVYVGHAYDASHNIFDTHTLRAGVSYSF